MPKRSLLTRINDFGKRSEKFATDLHNLAVETLEHAKQHNDANMIKLLISKLSKSQRRNDLAAWVKEYTPIQVHIKASGEVSAKIAKPEQKLWKEWNLEEARAVPFWILIAEPPSNLVGRSNIFGAIFAAKAKLEKAIEEGTYLGDPEHDMKLINAAIKATKLDEEALKEQRKADKEAKENANA